MIFTSLSKCDSSGYSLGRDTLAHWSTIKTQLLALAFLVMSVSDVVLASGSSKAWGSQGNKERSANAFPFFRPTPQNITVRPGDKATLRCQVDNLGAKTVSWHYAETRHPITIGLFTFTSDSRVSVDFNQRANEWSLIIHDVRPEDEGTYQCVVSTKDISMTYDIQLTVKTVQLVGTEFVERGSQIDLKCNATGRPDPPHDVRWMKDGTALRSDDNNENRAVIKKSIEPRALISTLTIRVSRQADAGDYSCQSSNGDMATLRVHVLNVQPPPNVKRENKGASMAMLASSSRGSSVSQRFFWWLPEWCMLCVLTVGVYTSLL